jgi:putative ribosome biogenesis GTPase RsgA
MMLHGKRTPKKHMKELADAKNKAEERQMMVGDKVLVKQQSAKLKSGFAPVIHTVVKVKGSMIK